MAQYFHGNQHLTALTQLIKLKASKNFSSNELSVF